MDRKKIGFVVLTVLYGVLLYQFAFHPLLGRVRKLKDNLHQVKLQLVEVQKTVNKLADLQKELRIRNEELEKLEVQLFSSQDFNDFITGFTSWAKELGVETVSLNFHDRKDNIYPAKVVEVFLRGSFKNISRLLQKVEEMEKLSVVKGFYLERISSQPVMILGKIEVEITVKE